MVKSARASPMVYVENLDNFIEAAQQLFISSPGDVSNVHNARKMWRRFFFPRRDLSWPLIAHHDVTVLPPFADSILDKIQAFGRAFSFEGHR